MRDKYRSWLIYAALDIYLERKYYIYDSLTEHEKTGSAEQSIANYFQKEWEQEMYGEGDNSTSYKSNIKDEDLPF